MFWACFEATGPGHIAVTESTISSSVCQSILGATSHGLLSTSPHFAAIIVVISFVLILLFSISVSPCFCPYLCIHLLGIST